MNTDNQSAGITCKNCNGAIQLRDKFYFINDNTYCIQCKTIAQQEILKEVEHSYIYVYK